MASGDVMPGQMTDRQWFAAQPGSLRNALKQAALQIHNHYGGDYRHALHLLTGIARAEDQYDGED